MPSLIRTLPGAHTKGKCKSGYSADKSYGKSSLERTVVDTVRYDHGKVLTL